MTFIFLGCVGFLFLFLKHINFSVSFIIKDDFSLSLFTIVILTSVDEAEQRDDSVLLNVLTQKKEQRDGIVKCLNTKKSKELTLLNVLTQKTPL